MNRPDVPNWRRKPVHLKWIVCQLSVFPSFPPQKLPKIQTGPWFPCSRRRLHSAVPGTRLEELFCCSGLAVELLAQVAKGEPNTPDESAAGQQADTGFSFELHLNESYGAVLLNEEEGGEGRNGGFRLSGMVWHGNWNG
jgi:hypothetical protein